MSDAAAALSRDDSLSMPVNHSAGKRAPYRKWRREENEQIAAARKAGSSIREIAVAHRASVNQIASKLYAWGMCKPHRPRGEPWERDWRNPAPLAREIQQRSSK